MGIVQRQTIKNNIVSLLAVAVAAVASIRIYPEDEALQGYMGSVAAYALLLVPLVSLGSTTVMVRFLPVVEGERMRAAGQLFTRSALTITAVLALLCGLNFLIGDWLIGWFVDLDDPEGIIAHHRWAILGVLAALSYSGLLTTHLINFKRIAVPVIFNNLLLKLGAPALFLLIFTESLGREWLDPGLVLLYGLVTVGLLTYALSLGVLRPAWGRLRLQNTDLREVYRLALYSVLGAVGSRLTIYIDMITVGEVRGVSEAGIYSLAAFVVGVIILPYTAVNSITSPIVAAAWERRDFKELGFLYRESSLVLFAAGGLIYAGALVCMPHVYGWTDNLGKYAIGYSAVILLGAAKLFDLLTSINGNLIAMTAYYRWNVFFILFLGLLNVALNALFLIVLDFGIAGAALATMISSVLYNILKVALIWWKMGLQPLTGKHALVFICLLGCALLAWLVPVPGNDVLAVGVRGGVLVALFAMILYIWPIVPRIHGFMRDRI